MATDQTGHIQADKLTKNFRKTQAVRGVDFDVAPGEIYGLIGPDGAGKTTTIRMLAGVMKPTSGIARVSGFDTAREAENLRQQVGYMAQRFSLYGDLSVRENIEFYADIFGVRGKDREPRIKRLLQFARLEEFQERDAGVLSGGMKKKLGTRLRADSSSQSFVSRRANQRRRSDFAARVLGHSQRFAYSRRDDFHQHRVHG